MDHFGQFSTGLAHPQMAAPGYEASAKQERTIVADNSIHAEDSDSEGKPEKRSGRRKIKIEFIEDKSRRHITFSKRKAGIMKKAYELSTLTGTQVLLLVVSETGLVYTFTTPKLQPLVTKPEGKNLIQACLNAPDPEPATAEPEASSSSSSSSRSTSQSNTAGAASVGKTAHGNSYSASIRSHGSSGIYTQTENSKASARHPSTVYPYGYSHDASTNSGFPAPQSYTTTYQSAAGYYGSTNQTTTAYIPSPQNPSVYSVRPGRYDDSKWSSSNNNEAGQ